MEVGGVCRKVGGGSQEWREGLVWREEDLGGVRMRRWRGEREGKEAGWREPATGKAERENPGRGRSKRVNADV